MHRFAALAPTAHSRQNRHDRLCGSGCIGPVGMRHHRKIPLSPHLETWSPTAKPAVGTLIADDAQPPTTQRVIMLRNGAGLLMPPRPHPTMSPLRRSSINLKSATTGTPRVRPAARFFQRCRTLLYCWAPAVTALRKPRKSDPIGRGNRGHKPAGNSECLFARWPPRIGWCFFGKFFSFSKPSSDSAGHSGLAMAKIGFQQTHWFRRFGKGFDCVLARY